VSCKLDALRSAWRERVHRVVDPSLLAGIVVEIEALFSLAAEAPRFDHALEGLRWCHALTKGFQKDHSGLAGDVEPDFVQERDRPYGKTEVENRSIDAFDRSPHVEEAACFIQ